MQKEQRVLSIKELTKYIKMKLEGDILLQDVWVRGEISNFTHHSSGHMYFTLKDEASRIKSIMFASQNQRLPFIPKEGTMVIARGNISIYDRDGQYQFYVTQMQPDGIGSLFLAFEQLKLKLEAEGLFAIEHKKVIPRFPKAIGVITSPTGAAVRDIIITLQRRYPTVPVIVFPVVVQGTQAAPIIAKAIDRMNELGEVDVLIIGRGGGSLEELWPFNEEVVARSIYASKLPIISAVGHETDFTIADFVADLRAATPTAAAELAVPHHLELRQQIHHNMQRLIQHIQDQVQRRRLALTRITRSPFLTQPHRQLLQPTERLDRLKEQLLFRIRSRIQKSVEKTARLEKMLAKHHPGQHIHAAKARLDRTKSTLLLTMQTTIKEDRNRLSSHIRQLDALSPLKVMQRGYSLVYDEKEATLIKSISQIQPGDVLKIRMTDGQIDCQVWSMRGEGDENEVEGN
ncbi:MAG: exodeoxyribonuclease VII large subunit [Paenibacillaceae bacterium]